MLSRSTNLNVPKRKSENAVSWGLPHLASDTHVKLRSGNHNPVVGVDGEDAYAKLTTIDRFCTTIQHRTDHDTHEGMGILTTKTNSTQPIRVWACTHRFMSYNIDSAQVISQESLLATPKPLPKSRMLLALKLASSVMQLHSSPWLDDF